MSADMWGATRWGGRTPFKKRLVHRPIQPPTINDFEDMADDVYDIYPPRAIKLGVLIDEFTGEEIEDFWLPIADEAHEPSIALIGGSGSGKTVAATRLIDEMRRRYGRSLLIFDSKNQYINMNKENEDKNHMEILERIGEKTSGCDEIKIYIPKHVIRKDGEEFCKLTYQYTDDWIINTGDIDATALLMLGQKKLSDRDYINVLASIIDNLRVKEREEGLKFNLDTIIDELEAEKEEMPAKKRSVDTLMVMIDNLAKGGIIADDGNSVMELFHKPKRINGNVVIFNTAGSSPDDIQTKGLITNMVSSISQKLKLYIDKVTKLPMYCPIILIEEASLYYGKNTDSKMLEAFNHLQNVMGRTAGIMRVYVFQNDKQPAEGLIDNDNMQIIIRMMQSVTLKNGRQIFGKGYAWVNIRNVDFMQDQSFLVRIYPPKCEIGS